MNIKSYEKLIEGLTSLMDEGVHVVDQRGVSIVYSQAMASIEKVKQEDVLGKKFREAFAHIPEEESTLWRALKEGKKTLHRQQTFLNIHGREVTTMNSTVPIKLEGEVVAAIEVAKDITEIKKMSDTILKIQEEYIDPPKVFQPKVRHYNFYDLIGENKNFKETIEIARKASKSKTSVFIYGETGTGKELFAQSMHYDGIRKHGPFLAQNCAALPESLLEGILFGTTKGGFTGAVDRAGLFEQANGGTLLLDEVSAMPYELQSKLLRVLQEDYIRRIGGTKDIPVDIKIIATVNKTPKELMDTGLLRRDLFYRLGIINLDIPPLRKRKDDIPILVERFVYKQKRNLQKIIPGISQGAIDKLQSYDYPGNVRELENIIIAAIAMADDNQELTEEHIILNPMEVTNDGHKNTFNINENNLDEFMFNTEKSIVEEALQMYDNNISKASEALGIKRQTLQHKIKKYKK